MLQVQTHQQKSTRLELSPAESTDDHPAARGPAQRPAPHPATQPTHNPASPTSQDADASAHGPAYSPRPASPDQVAAAYRANADPLRADEPDRALDWIKALGLAIGITWGGLLVALAVEALVS